MNNGKQTVNIHGKEYELVSSRINRFRTDYPDWSIRTEIVRLENGVCCMRAMIIDDKDIVRATGIAQEKEGSSMINKTSYVECCESSAIGRALACFNYQGGEYASAEEVANAIKQQGETRPATRPVPQKQSGITPKNPKALISDGQIRLILARLKNKGVSEETFKNDMQIESLKNITMGEMNSILEFIENYGLIDGGTNENESTPAIQE